MLRIVRACRPRLVSRPAAACRSASNAIRDENRVVASRPSTTEEVGRTRRHDPGLGSPFPFLSPSLLSSPFAALNAFANAFDRSIAQSFGNSQFPLRMPRSFEEMESQVGKALSDTLGIKSLNADIAETASDFIISVEVPGVAKDAVKIDVDDREGVITIAAERRMESEVKPEAASSSDASKDATTANESKDVTWHRIERSYGHVSRTLRMPENANLEAVSAKLDNGVLKITVPKREPTPTSPSRRVEIA